MTAQNFCIAFAFHFKRSNLSYAFSPARYSLTVKNHGLRHQSLHFIYCIMPLFPGEAVFIEVYDQLRQGENNSTRTSHLAFRGQKDHRRGWRDFGVCWVRKGSSSVSRQMGISTSHLYMQLDHFAWKLSCCCCCCCCYHSIVVELGSSMWVVTGLNPAQTDVTLAIEKELTWA